MVDFAGVPMKVIIGSLLSNPYGNFTGVKPLAGCLVVLVHDPADDFVDKLNVCNDVGKDFSGDFFENNKGDSDNVRLDDDDNTLGDVSAHVWVDICEVFVEGCDPSLQDSRETGCKDD